jgi:hypothetical protein
VEEVPIAHGQPKEQLAPVRVVDDLHGLEHRAGRLLAMPRAGGHHHQLLRARVLHGLGKSEREIAAQVRDRLLLERRDVGDVAVVIRIELVVPDELRRLLLVRHVQTVPVDDGVTAQDQPHGVHILQAELGQIAQAPDALARAIRRATGRRGRRIAIHPRLGSLARDHYTPGCVLVASRAR